MLAGKELGALGQWRRVSSSEMLRNQLYSHPAKLHSSPSTDHCEFLRDMVPVEISEWHEKGLRHLRVTLGVGREFR